MSALGPILAGIAVAIGGVFIGRKLEQARAAMDDSSDSPQKATDQSADKNGGKIIDARKNPQTGSFEHHGRASRK